MEPCLAFSVGGAMYALPLGSVDGVDPRGVIARVPDAPPYMRGVIGRRGTVLPVIDLVLLLGLPVTSSPSGDWMVVIRDGSLLAGIEVEGLPSVVDWVDVSKDAPVGPMAQQLSAAALLQAVEAAGSAP